MCFTGSLHAANDVSYLPSTKPFNRKLIRMHDAYFGNFVFASSVHRDNLLSFWDSSIKDADEGNHTYIVVVPTIHQQCFEIFVSGAFGASQLARSRQARIRWNASADGWKQWRNVNPLFCGHMYYIIWIKTKGVLNLFCDSFWFGIWEIDLV